MGRWLERKLDGLAEGIGREAGSWLRTMRDGGPRSGARSLETVWCHMNNVRPALLDWSQRYDHLREVTRDDVQAILGGLHGTRRSRFLVSLRSLFAFCKKKGMIFRNPASGIKAGQHPARVSRAAWRLKQAERERAWALASARAQGVSIRVLAAEVGLSPARVHQIVTGANLDALDATLGELRSAGWPAPEDPGTSEDTELDGRDLRVARCPSAGQTASVT